MRFNDQSPIHYSGPLPQAVDAVVIGAGVIGICTALFLRRSGVSVLVLDKGRVAGEQSSRNWGWVRQNGRDLAELPIVMESVGLWEQFSAEMGPDIGFRRGGCLFLAKSEQELASYQPFLQRTRELQLDSRLLGAAELETVLPLAKGQWSCALYTPSDGRAEPFTAVPALARKLVEEGGQIKEACAVRELDIQGGSICGVVTENGRIRASTVLCAAGAWSSLLLRHHGIDLPQLCVRSTVARTAACAEVFSGTACGDDLAFRRRLDGGYTLALGDQLDHFVTRDSFRYARHFWPLLSESWGSMRLRLPHGAMRRTGRPRRWHGESQSPFETMRVWDPDPDPRAVARIRSLIPLRLPQLSGVEIVESWAGMIDALPDVVPVMDQVSRIPGLYLATGFSGHGFGIGPAAGRVVADLIQGRDPGHDLQRFRFERFSDGSVLEPGPFI